jgi:hypothetical protein
MSSRKWMTAVSLLTMGGMLLGTPAQAAATATVSASAGVVAMTTTADGITHITFYDPAPGVSDQQLYQGLKTRGVPGLRQPTASRTIAQLGTPVCTLGTASSAYCPQVHWARNGYDHPQIYFVDHTGPAWPVIASVQVWNQAHGVDSLYRSGTCPGIWGTHCVDVSSANQGNNNTVGTTTVAVDADHNFIDGGVNVVMNDYYTDLTAARHRKSVCHELGHVIGVGHNTSTASCMKSGDFDGQQPNNDDFAMAANVYSSF